MAGQMLPASLVAIDFWSLSAYDASEATDSDCCLLSALGKDEHQHRQAAGRDWRAGGLRMSTCAACSGEVEAVLRECSA